jgi:hypothetical protein
MAALRNMWHASCSKGEKVDKRCKLQGL